MVMWKDYLTPSEVDELAKICLLYTSDAADDLLCVDLGGRRIIKKKKPSSTSNYHKLFQDFHPFPPTPQMPYYQSRLPSTPS